MKFTAQSSVQEFTGWISGKLAKRLDAAREKLEVRIRRKFERDARLGTSSPGTYPKMLRGHLRNNISVDVTKGLFGLRRTGLHVSVQGRGRLRHDALEKGYTIRPKQAKSLAMPVSILARMMSSNGLGPRSFPHALTMKRVTHHGRSVMALVTKRSGVTRKIHGGGTHKVHYILIRQARIKPRRGVASALKAEFDWLGKFLTDRLD